MPGVLRAQPLFLQLIDRIANQADPARQRRLLAVLIDEISDAEQETLLLPMPRDARLCSLAICLAQDPSSSRTLDDWCGVVGVSKRTLVRRFRSETGLSFVEWRTRARVMRSIELLSAGSTVTRAAMETGYDSVSAFIDVFRRHVGVLPARFASRRHRESHQVSD